MTPELKAQLKCRFGARCRELLAGKRCEYKHTEEERREAAEARRAANKERAAPVSDPAKGGKGDRRRRWGPEGRPEAPRTYRWERLGRTSYFRQGAEARLEEARV